ncbi:YciI family protein [Solirubrobacter sp. CPCC 204708]|uniref:YciI family protein n=1 Tax=Solirubrobacter deserti TaxID=2282478 RepID=A0ABT4RUP2_9ACTN|nr:YciI family protein [Solirubrobacter deserti]MBE2319337.1 YciI family protein [Solirubrobacter deserti]MDA0142301.1 YciI family protein [Solirubrobacter deserti]
MKVLLTFYGEEKTGLDSSPEQIAETFKTWGEFDAATRAAGAMIACEGLEGGHAATTVRIAGDDRRVTDGPFMETKEQLGGFALLEVSDLDEALEWAARTPWNRDGHVTEIRPVMDYSQYAARLEGTGLEGAIS